MKKIKPQITQDEKGLNEKVKNIRRIERQGKVFRMLLFFAMIIALLCISVTNKFNRVSAYETGFIKNDHVEDLAQGTAYFIREELPISSKTDGKLVTQYNEGERVSNGIVAAYVVKAGMEDSLNQVKNIEKLIATSHSDNSNNNNSNELIKLNTEISSKTSKLAVFAMKGNLSEFGLLKKELDSLLSKKFEIVSGVNKQDGYVANLENERSEILEQLKNEIEEINTTSSGLISFNIDGLEEELSTVNLEDLTPEYLSNIKIENKSVDNRNIKTGDIIAKILPEVFYNIAVVINGDYKVKEGSTVIIKSKDRSFETIATVVSYKKYGDNILIICKSTSDMASSLAYRKAEVDVVFSDYIGMTVPLRCLFDLDVAGTSARIAVIRANYVQYKRVSILMKNKEYAVINNAKIMDPEVDNIAPPINVNDIYILNPNKVFEGQVIGK